MDGKVQAVSTVKILAQQVFVRLHGWLCTSPVNVIQFNYEKARKRPLGAREKPQPCTPNKSSDARTLEFPPYSVPNGMIQVMSQFAEAHTRIFSGK